MKWGFGLWYSRYSCWYSPLIWVHTTGLLGSTLCFDFKELKGYKIPVWLILEWVHPISMYVYFSVFVYMIPKQHFIPVQGIPEWVHSKNCVVWRKWRVRIWFGVKTTQVRTPYRLSHLILSCECSTNFTLERINSWINCGMKVIPVSFQWPLSTTLSNISFFFLFCSNAYLSARRVKHFIRDQIEASSPAFNNIITTAK